MATASRSFFFVGPSLCLELPLSRLKAPLMSSSLLPDAATLSSNLHISLERRAACRQPRPHAMIQQLSLVVYCGPLAGPICFRWLPHWVCQLPPTASHGPSASAGCLA